jgi:hypothetical protein
MGQFREIPPPDFALLVFQIIESAFVVVETMLVQLCRVGKTGDAGRNVSPQHTKFSDCAAVLGRKLQQSLDLPVVFLRA